MRLHRVNDRLFRSEQPGLDELDQLKAEGIDTIVNLRKEEAALIRAERRRAEELGMRFLHFPFYGIFGADDAFLDSVLAEVRRPENGVVLVHCKNGRDRTSLIVGLDDVLSHGTSVEEAWERDFVAFGHDPDRPMPPWNNPFIRGFFENVRRTFRRYLATHVPERINRG